MTESTKGNVWELLQKLDCDACKRELSHKSYDEVQKILKRLGL